MSGREVLPFGPFEDPKTCKHEWEPHIYERGKDYCPYCTSMRDAPQGTKPKQGERG